MSFHGHLCPGQVFGIRMALAGYRELGLEFPRSVGKRLVVLVEIDRSATDAIQAITGVSPGKRTLRHVDYGKMAGRPGSRSPRIGPRRTRGSTTMPRASGARGLQREAEELLTNAASA